MKLIVLVLMKFAVTFQHNFPIENGLRTTWNV